MMFLKRYSSPNWKFKPSKSEHRSPVQVADDVTDAGAAPKKKRKTTPARHGPVDGRGGADEFSRFLNNNNKKNQQNQMEKTLSTIDDDGDDGDDDVDGCT